MRKPYERMSGHGFSPKEGRAKTEIEPLVARWGKRGVFSNHLTGAK